MAKLDLKSNRKNVSDLMGIDFSSTGVKVVRLRKGKDSISLVGADLLPAVDIAHPPSKLSLPKALISNYASLAYTGETAVIRIMQMALDPAGKPEDTDALLRQQLNLDESYRAGCYVVQQAKGKQESLLMTVAIPKSDLNALLGQFETGAPAAYSLEISGLAAFSGFMQMDGAKHADDTLCLIETGARMTLVAFVVRGQPALVAKYAVGAASLVQRIETDLGVDADMVRTILAGGSVDVSNSVNAVMGSLLKQLSISRDFVERQHKTRVSHTYISGGMARSPYWVGPIQETMTVNCVAWDPLAQLKILPNAWPDKLTDQQYRFAGAIGAALGGLSEE